MIKIKLLSDIHIEINPNFKIDLSGVDILCLAGDIGEEPNGINWAFSLLKDYKDLHIVYVLGNHSCYGKFNNIDKIKNKLNDILNSKTQECFDFNDSRRFHFLENDSVLIYGIKFISSCLWTDFNNRNMNDINVAWSSMNDFNYIRQSTTYTKFTPYRAATLHEKAREYIFNELNNTPKDTRCIVVTHHQPYLSSKNTELKYAYENNLDNYFENCNNPPIYWFSGHTHESEIITHKYPNGSITFISNQLGYPNENTGFNKDFLLKIPTS